MASIPPTVLAGVPAVLGLLSHALWFIRGEHDFYSRIYLVLGTGVQATGFFVLTRILNETSLKAVQHLTVISTAYFVALFSSILVYRLFLHELRRFPGPLSWRITKFTQMSKNIDGFGYRHLDNLHKQYGKIVRTGPSEISIIDPAAPQIVLGPGSKCRKAIWYDIQAPLVALHTCRDKKLHDTRRRAWDKGFSMKSLRDYEIRVSKYTNLLMKQIQSFGGGALSATKWFNYYSFDVMGDLAFGESFKMLDSGEQHFAIKLLKGGMESMSITPPIPWFFYIIAKIPMLSAGYHNFIAWCDEQAQRRKAMKVSEPDIMSHLLEAPPMSNDEWINRNWQMGDSRLIIVAGSDTTAATLAYCAYELIKSPESIAKIREEVRSFVYDGSVDHNALLNCDFLNAVIDESLRLHPPVPSGLVRIAPPEGINIGDTFIPGETIMVLPLYSIQRSAEAYEHPNEFIPDRWTDRPELIKHKGAFAPFSLGAFACVGKNLAYMEVRSVLATLLTKFDIAFADREDGSDLINKSRDTFTIDLADMYITCKPREVKAH